MKKRAKLDVLFELMMEHIIDFNSLGTSMEALKDPLKLADLKETVPAAGWVSSGSALWCLRSGGGFDTVNPRECLWPDLCLWSWLP